MPINNSKVPHRSSSTFYGYASKRQSSQNGSESDKKDKAKSTTSRAPLLNPGFLRQKSLSERSGTNRKPLLKSDYQRSNNSPTPRIRASDVVVNGESFFAMSNITSELSRLARRDGYIGENESFREIAVSGSNISQIMNYYQNCNPKPLYLISDGGGIDLLMGGTIQSTLNTLRQYIGAMKRGGTKKFLWMRYPDPQGPFWAGLKAKHDVYNPEAERLCRASTDPKCLWVDLRPVWNGHSEYTTDGIHASNAGGTASAEAFWAAMKRNNFFDLSSSSTKVAFRRISNGENSVKDGRDVGRNKMKVDNVRPNGSPKPPRNLFASAATREGDEAQQQGEQNFGTARFRSIGR